MSNQKQITDLIKSISGQSNILTIPRIFIDITGDHVSALFLSQCIYWSDKGTDGWFYKSDREWSKELGLTPFQLRRCRTTLKDLLIIKKKRANGAPTYHYKVDFGLLTNSIINKLDYQQTSQSESEETSQSESEETSQSLTETTQEITKKNINENFQILSSAFWSITGIPVPSAGGRGWSDYEDGINGLLKINATPDEMKIAKTILDEAGYTCNRPGAMIKTILNTRNGNKKKKQSQSVGGSLIQ